jgi:hypothetical protein
VLAAAGVLHVDDDRKLAELLAFRRLRDGDEHLAAVAAGGGDDEADAHPAPFAARSLRVDRHRLAAGSGGGGVDRQAVAARRGLQHVVEAAAGGGTPGVRQLASRGGRRGGLGGGGGVRGFHHVADDAADGGKALRAGRGGAKGAGDEACNRNLPHDALPVRSAGVVSGNGRA